METHDIDPPEPPNGLLGAVLRLLGASDDEERQAWLVMRYWGVEDTPDGVIADCREALRIVRHPAAGDVVRMNAAGALRVFDGHNWKQVNESKTADPDTPSS